MIVKFLEPAIVELDDAFKYYEYQQQNLGTLFIREVESAVERIITYPKAWHKLSTNTRRCLVKNFPFGVIYKIQEETILIVAVMNLHRKPEYWVDWFM